MVTRVRTLPVPISVGGIVLSDNSYKILCLRFLRKRSDGKPTETPEETLWCVASHEAREERRWGKYPV